MRRGGGGEVVVCGIHAVAAMVREGRAKRVFVAGAGGRVRALAAEAAAGGVPVLEKSRPALEALVGEARHQGVAAAAALPEGDLAEVAGGDAPLVVLDGVTDPRNLGAILRVARGFAAAAVVTPAARSAPLSAAALRAAAGAAALVPVIRVANVARALRQMAAAGRCVLGADESGRALFGRPVPVRVCWVLGDEGGGLRRLTRERCHELVRIPAVAGEAGCLNVACAAAVCLAAGAAGGEGGAP